ncbi:MAG TPA: hypothetical protein DCY31_08085 [Ruminococcaceae bacterium]|nr:hypothetical protein [Oscillospiraceae bacterium]
MKETTNDMAKNTTEVFWIRDAREDFLDGQRALTMTVTDGRVQRKALWMNTPEKAENVINSFKKFDGIIYDDNMFMVNDVKDTNYAFIDFDRFFALNKVPLNVMYRYLGNISKALPPLLAVPCLCTVNQFEAFTCKRTAITEAELYKRIQATREAFETVVHWQHFLQSNAIDESYVIMAGVIIGSFSSFFENELLLPGWEMMPSEILACDFNHTAKELKLDKDTSNKIKKVIHAMYYRSSDEMEKAIVTNTFFKKN